MTSRESIFKVGDKIQLTRIDLEDQKTYPSQILDILEEDRFMISGPIYKNKLVLIHKGELLRISCVVENKGRYAFNGEVVERKYDNIYKLEIRKVSEIKRYQQRKFFRFDVSIPVIKEFVIGDGDDEEVLIEECRSKDISGNGLKLYTNYEHNVGDIVTCKFELDGEKLEVKGKILRRENVDTFEYDYALGIQFIDIKEADTDKIIQFIFARLRKLREKGLI